MGRSMPIPTFSQGFAQSAGEARYSNLWKGLVGLWSPHLGKQGNKLYDWSGIKNHGVLTNMTNDDWVASPYGIALDGVNDQVIMADRAEYTPADDFTVSMWIRLLSFPAGSTTILSKDDGVSREWNFHWNQGLTRYQFFTKDDSVTAWWVVNDLGWHHLVGTLNGIDATKIIYGDGNFIMSGAYGATIVNTSEELVIGGTANFGNFEIAHLGLWNRTLSSSEARFLYMNPWALHEPTITMQGATIGIGLPILSEHGIHSKISGVIAR